VAAHRRGSGCLSEIALTRDGSVAVLTLDAAGRRNALTPEMARALSQACDEIDADERVGAVVVRGAGGSFCAGADLGALAAVGEDPLDAANYADLEAIYEAFVRVGELRAPTVAAVRGAAVGAGLNLALVTDLRIIADDATLVAGFLRIGVHPGGGSLTMLNQRAGREAAAAMAIFGERIDGRRAVELGLAWRSLPDNEVEEGALELARTAAADPELARLAVRSLRSEAGTNLPVRVALEYERASQLWSLSRRARREAPWRSTASPARP
jgi:enoyl-CoA hydratase